MYVSLEEEKCIYFLISNRLKINLLRFVLSAALRFFLFTDMRNRQYANFDDVARNIVYIARELI